MKNHILLLVAVLMLGCAGVDVRQNVNTNGPSAVVKRALAYLQSDQADADGRAKGFTGDSVRGKCLPDDLILEEVRYSPYHQDVEVSFILRHSLGKRKSASGSGTSDGYETVSVKVDHSGRCQIFSAGESSSCPGTTKLQSRIPTGQEFEDALIQADRYIAEGKVRFSESNLEKTEWPDDELGKDPNSEKELAKLEEIIRKKIPQRLRASHVKLLGIARSRSLDEIEITYSLTPTIIIKSSSRAECLTLEISVDKVGVCKAYNLGRSKRSLDLGPTSIEFPITFSKEQDDIFEAVFRHMFKDESYHAGKIRMRFLTVGPTAFLTDPFFKRFKDDKIPSRSPYRRCADYKGSWFNNQYFPNYEDAQLYEITEIKRFDENHVFVSGRIRWGVSSVSGYIYTVKKVNNRWKVIRQELEWFG